MTASSQNSKKGNMMCKVLYSVYIIVLDSCDIHSMNIAGTDTVVVNIGRRDPSVPRRPAMK